QARESAEERRWAGVPEARSDGQRSLPWVGDEGWEDTGKGTAAVSVGAGRISRSTLRGLRGRRERPGAPPAAAGRHARGPEGAAAVLHRVRDGQRHRAGREEVHLDAGEAGSVRNILPGARGQRLRGRTRD